MCRTSRLDDAPKGSRSEIETLCIVIDIVVLSGEGVNIKSPSDLTQSCEQTVFCKPGAWADPSSPSER